jgi:nitrile hydratase
VDGVHDMGGLQGFGSVVAPGRELSHHEPWELRAQVLGLVGGLTTRAAIEALDPAVYLGSGYYERWLLTAESGFAARGSAEADVLERWRSTLADDPATDRPTSTDPAVVAIIRGLGPHQHTPADHPAFAVGDTVRVRRMRPERHHRCPRYLRGAEGRIEKVLGDDPVPGLRPDEAVSETCYTVGFSSVDLFGDPPDGERPHTVLIDLWERYLEGGT